MQFGDQRIDAAWLAELGVPALPSPLVNIILESCGMAASARVSHLLSESLSTDDQTRMIEFRIAGDDQAARELLVARLSNRPDLLGQTFSEMESWLIAAVEGLPPEVRERLDRLGI